MATPSRTTTESASGLTGKPPRVIQRSLQAPLPFKLGDVVARRYQIRRLIGEGPLGVVYVAHDRETEVDLALKVMRPALLPLGPDRQVFVDSMGRLRGLGHFNLNHVIEVDQDGDRCFFTTPLLEGLSLRKLMGLRRARGDRFTLGEVVPIAAQVADALAAGSRMGAHGDLKPDNVVILPEMLKVTDFGLGAALPRPDFLAAQESSVEASAYLSPEVRAGAPPDARSDIFAFGVMIVELLSGRLPTTDRVRLRDFQPDLPETLDDLAQRMLSEDPAQRPDSPEDAVQEIAAAESGTIRGAISPKVRRTFAPEQTLRISNDMLEEVLETAEGMDEDTFAGQLEAEAAAIDQQTAAALAETSLTDPALSSVTDPDLHVKTDTFQLEDPDRRPSPDVTQKISSEMVVEMLQGGPVDLTSTRGRRRDRSATDELDPRLVRAALGMELDDASADAPREDSAEITAQSIPRMTTQPDLYLGAEETDRLPRFGASTEGEPLTTRERPLPERTGPVLQLPDRGPGDTLQDVPSSARPTIPDHPSVDATQRVMRPMSPPASVPRIERVALAPAPVVAPPGPSLAQRKTTPAPPPVSVPPPPAAPARAAPAPSSAAPAIAAPPVARTLQGMAMPAVAPAPPVAPPPAPVAPPPVSPAPVRPAAPAPAPRAAPTPAPVAPRPAAPVASAASAAPVARRPDPAVPAGAVRVESARAGTLPAEDGPRYEPTRIIHRSEKVRRDRGGFWVWIALAIGLLAFLVGAGFYWQRLQRDARDQAARELVRQLQQNAPPPLPLAPMPPGAGAPGPGGMPPGTTP